MSAYTSMYLNDAAENLGTMFEYAINVRCVDPDKVYKIFAGTKIARLFETGHPMFTVGMCGTELFDRVMEEAYGYECEQSPQYYHTEYNREYWAGWAVAHYQWYSGMHFDEIYEKGLTFSKVMDMYILHEADITRFYDAANMLIERGQTEASSMLKRLRMYAKFTQKTLSEQSGVSLRMIQLYEQGQNDIAKAEAGTVLALSKALHCSMEDLVER